MRTALKSRLFGILRAAGVNALVRDTEWRRERLAILCYHGVSIADEHEAWPALYTTPALLRRRLQHLRDEGYRVLSLEEGLHRLGDGTLPRRSVVLTFDDGTRDFARVVVPLLREFGVPATVYPTTYYADRGQPIFDVALVYVLWRGRQTRVDWAEFTGGTSRGRPSAAGHAAVAAAIRGRAITAGLDADAKDRLLRRIAERVGVDYNALVAAGLFQAMRAEELRVLPRALVDVQLHTHRHRVPASASLLAREVADNRAFLLRAGVGSSGAHFCYPNGDATAAAAERLRGLGIHSGTTCTPGLAAPTNDLLRLPRFVDHSRVSDATFAAWVSGVAELVPRARVYRARARRASGQPAANAGAARAVTGPSSSCGAGNP